MPGPTKLDIAAVDTWIKAHPGWERVGDLSLQKRFTPADFADALAFAVRVGMLAQKRDHHPEVEISWGHARVLWSTHDAGGITVLDLELAEATDKLQT